MLALKKEVSEHFTWQLKCASWDLCKSRVKLCSFPCQTTLHVAGYYLEAILLSDDSVREAAETKQK